MKANELMIGDWVLDGNIYAQVTSITCDGNIETTHNEHSNIELVKPIPLTPEILEKNGFNVNKYSDGDYYADIMFEDQGRRVEIEYMYGTDIDVCVTGRNNTPPFSRIETPVRYVHELQHIFRIAKINKEVVL